MDINEFEDFQPLDFLDLANELNCNIEKFNASSSSVKRNIFGRIYYAIFLYGREWLLKHTNYTSQPKKNILQCPSILNQMVRFLMR